MYKLKCYKCGKEVLYSNGGLRRIYKSKIFCFDCQMKKYERRFKKIALTLDNAKKL